MTDQRMMISSFSYIPVTVTDFMDITGTPYMIPNICDTCVAYNSHVNRNSVNQLQCETTSVMSFMELDNRREGNDIPSITKYDIKPKEENNFTDCTFGTSCDNEQYSHLPRCCENTDLPNCSLQMEHDFTDMKCENSPYSEIDTFGQTVVLTLQREINTVCKTLGIGPGNS